MQSNTLKFAKVSANWFINMEHSTNLSNGESDWVSFIREKNLNKLLMQQVNRGLPSVSQAPMYDLKGCFRTHWWKAIAQKEIIPESNC